MIMIADSGVLLARCDWSRHCAWTTEGKADILCRTNQDCIIPTPPCTKDWSLNSLVNKHCASYQNGTIAQNKEYVQKSQLIFVDTALLLETMVHCLAT